MGKLLCSWVEPQAYGIKCFAGYVQSTKLLDSIRLDVVKVVEVLQQCDSLIEVILCNPSYTSTPAPKRVVFSTASLEVVVNKWLHEIIVDFFMGINADEHINALL